MPELYVPQIQNAHRFRTPTDSERRMRKNRNADVDGERLADAL
jgi:hypothetical protein